MVVLLNRQFQPVPLELVDGNTTVLEYLRSIGLCGTKEGCAAGDCGACTAVVGSLNQEGGIDYKSINTCLALACALDGKHLISVEGLSDSDNDTLHPVQQAMVDCHGSQCGFCTPGFVMSLFAMYLNGEVATRRNILSNLSGNLCRCTGYAPILDAGLQALTNAKCNEPDFYLQHQQLIVRQLQVLQQNTSQQKNSKAAFYSPQTLEQLDDILEQNPKARLIAGGTDLTLEITQQLSTLACVVDLKRIPALQTIDTQQDRLTIGAAASLEDSRQSLLAYFPQLENYLERFASKPIRNWASLGGNIANASPIADMPPVLLVLGAKLRLRTKAASRTLELDDFYIDYKQTALAPDEYIVQIQLPALQANEQLVAYKISRRYEDDISAVSVALKLTLKSYVPVNCRIAFGGMAAIPRRSTVVENYVIKHWDSGISFAQLFALISQDFTPLDDVRASAAYRLHTAARLIEKAILKIQGVAVADLSDHQQSAQAHDEV